MSYETKDYHIGVIFHDDIDKHLTMMTCKRLGIRISSVYQALNGGKGIQTPFDRSSYKQLWHVWNILRRMKNARFTVAEARQEALNAVRNELEWLEYGSAPIYCKLSLSVLCNVDIDDEGNMLTLSDKEERLARLQELAKEYVTDAAHERISKEIYKKLRLRAEKLLEEDEEFRQFVYDEYNYRKESDDSVTLDEVAKEEVEQMIIIPDKLTMRARYDERPTYNQQLDKGVTMKDHRNSMSSKVRKMLSSIIDVKNLTDNKWRDRVLELNTSTVVLSACVNEEMRKKKARKDYSIFIPDELVKNFSKAVKNACHHTLDDHKNSNKTTYAKPSCSYV